MSLSELECEVWLRQWTWAVELFYEGWDFDGDVFCPF